MSFLEKIVCLINERFETLSYARKMVYGISMPVKRTKESGFDVVPMILDNEWKYVGVDDNQDLIIYHKIYGDTESIVPNSSYGDVRGLTRCVNDMSVVVFGNKLLLTPYALKQKISEYLLTTVTKTTLTELGLNSVNINATSSNMDPQSVWSNEYKNVDYPLDENNILFELRYRIETVYKKECQPC